MIIAKNLTKVYKTGGKEVKALDNVNFVLPDNGMVFIVGKSGSGKSTLLNMISGLDKITSGQIIAGGNSVGAMTAKLKEKYLSSYIGYVFQDYRLIEDFTVKQNIALAADISASDEIPERYLKLVGLSGYENRLPKELSGGQKQRVAIARALIKKPKVILADEPTGNLDASTTEEILKLLKAISKHTLVLIVSHNLRDAETYADRIIELSDGRIIGDLSRIEGYKNNFAVKDGVITLPHQKDLSQNEITALIKNARSTSTKIIQGGGGFAPTKPPVADNKRDPLYNKHMSLRNVVKIFGIFFKRKFLSKIATIVMAAVILSVFYVIQALTLYDTSNAIINTLVNSDSYGVIVQTSIGSASADKTIGRLREEKIQRLAEAYDGEYYRLYSEYMYTNPAGGGESYVTSRENTINFYSRITSGTLHTTEQYAAKMLGVEKLNYLAVAPEQKDYGVVITDYTADSIIARYKLADVTDPGKYPVYENYEELLGERSVAGERTYVNAIVDTNYEEEHAEIKNVLLSLSTDSDLGALVADMRYINFVADLEERYNIAYAFAENYPEALREYLVSSGSYMRFSSFFIDESRYSSSISVAVIKRDTVKLANGETVELADGEVIMGYNVYNKIFTQNLTAAEVKTAEFVNNFSHSRPLGMAQYESTAVKEIVNRSELTIKNLASSSSVIYVNENTYRDLMKFNTYTYSVYLDDPEAARDVMPLVEEMSLSIFSGKIGNLHFIQRCISIFENFFGITMVFILLACAIFLINFGIKSIRSSIYEIGVIKAMGGIKRDISRIFISQSLLIGLGILFGTYIGMQVAAFTANAVFLASLEVVANSNFYGIEAIDFYPVVALVDIVIALVVVVVSAIISNKTIDKLNLISILKAKE